MTTVDISDYPSPGRGVPRRAGWPARMVNRSAPGYVTLVQATGRRPPLGVLTATSQCGHIEAFGGSMAIRKIPSGPHPAPARPGSGDIGHLVPADRGLSTSIDATHRAVTAVLGGEDPDEGHMAIARLSAHLAAMRKTVYPAVRRQPGPARQVLAACLDKARELDWALRLLQCSLTGEVVASHLDADAISTRFQHYLDRYATAEGALITLLDERLPAGDREQIAARYRRALTHAPTRPHPRRPHTGAAYHVRFRLHAFWDRLLDTADARPGTGHDFPQPTPPGRPALTPPFRLLPGPGNPGGNQAGERHS